MGTEKYALLLSVILPMFSCLATTWPTASDYDIVRRWSEEGEAMCEETGECCPDTACVIPGKEQTKRNLQNFSRRTVRESLLELQDKNVCLCSCPFISDPCVRK